MNIFNPNDNNQAGVTGVGGSVSADQTGLPIEGSDVSTSGVTQTVGTGGPTVAVNSVQQSPNPAQAGDQTGSTQQSSGMPGAAAVTGVDDATTAGVGPGLTQEEEPEEVVPGQVVTSVGSATASGVLPDEDVTSKPTNITGGAGVVTEE